MIKVDDLIGCKYKIHGRSKEEGFDCYGLVKEVLKKVNCNLPEIDYVIDSPELFISCLSEFKHYKKIVRINSYTEGAVLLFENGNGCKCHIGVYIGDGFFVHCNKAGVHLDKVTALPKTTEIYIWRG